MIYLRLAAIVLVLAGLPVLGHAQIISNCGIASTSTIGCVKPDGATITINASGVISSSGGSATSFTPGTTTIGGATAPCFLENSTGTTSACPAVTSAFVTAMANTVNAASGPLTYSIVGTSGATLGLLNANKTDSGNNIWSGSTLTMSGLTSGTVATNSYIGLDASNHLVLGSGGGGGSSGANPTATAGASAINGSATTFMRSDAAPAVAKAGVSTFGIVEPDGQTILCPSGVCSTTAPTRTVTSSPTVLSTDMGGQIVMNVSGGGTLTVPAIGGGIFGNGQSLSVVNYSASTAAVSTTPTVNAGGGCVTATGIPAGYTWQMLSNGTSIDCFQTTGASSGTGTVTTVSVASANGFAGTVANATTTPAITVSTSVTGIMKGNGTAASAATAGTDYVAPGTPTTFTSAQTFGEVMGGINVQSGATYTIAASDCGKTILAIDNSAVTITIAASIVPASGTGCVIAVIQGGTAKVSVNGTAVSAATLVSAHSFTGTSGTQGSVIDLVLTTVSSTATAYLSGDGS